MILPLSLWYATGTVKMSVFYYLHNIPIGVEHIAERFICLIIATSYLPRLLSRSSFLFISRIFMSLFYFYFYIDWGRVCHGCMHGVGLLFGNRYSRGYLSPRVPNIDLCGASRKFITGDRVSFVAADSATEAPARPYFPGRLWPNLLYWVTLPPFWTHTHDVPLENRRWEHCWYLVLRSGKAGAVITSFILLHFQQRFNCCGSTHTSSHYFPLNLFADCTCYLSNYSFLARKDLAVSSYPN